MPSPYDTNAFTLSPASPQAALVLVTVLIIFAVVRYRDRPGAPEPIQSFGSRNLEIIWTAVPILCLVVLTVCVAWTMHVSDPPAPDQSPDLRIVGHQWWWEIDYLKSGAVAANEIHIPIGQFVQQMLSMISGCRNLRARWILFPAIPTVCGSRPVLPGSISERVRNFVVMSTHGCVSR